MDAPVNLHVVFEGEGLITDVALVGSFTRMDHRVALELPSVRTDHPTPRMQTRELLGSNRLVMLSHMPSQIGNRAKLLQTYRTHVLSFFIILLTCFLNRATFGLSLRITGHGC